MYVLPRARRSAGKVVPVRRFLVADFSWPISRGRVLVAEFSWPGGREVVWKNLIYDFCHPFGKCFLPWSSPVDKERTPVYFYGLATVDYRSADGSSSCRLNGLSLESNMREDTHWLKSTNLYRSVLISPGDDSVPVGITFAGIK